MSDAIEFTAQVFKVQTLVDNGIRVTLDLPETETVTMAKLAECQRFGAILQINASVMRHDDERKHTKRY
jgi:hypothetical protein